MTSSLVEELLNNKSIKELTKCSKFNVLEIEEKSNSNSEDNED